MMGKRGIIGSFVTMFVVTVAIVLILVVFIVASVFVKEGIGEEDKFGVQDESDVGIDDVFDYMDGQYDDMAQLRIIVWTGGRWEDWLTEEMKYGEK